MRDLKEVISKEQLADLTPVEIQQQIFYAKMCLKTLGELTQKTTEEITMMETELENRFKPKINANIN